jgi:hypothetical protein
MTNLSSITPSNLSWGDRFDEDRLTHNNDSEGDETQFPWTYSEWVTGPPSIVSVLEPPSRHRVGAIASMHHRLMRRSNRAP